MKVNEMLSVLFYLNGAKRTRDGLVPLYVRITVDGDRKEFASGKRLLPEHWTVQERATKDCPDYLSINSYITKTRAALEKCYNLLEATETKITAGMVKDKYMPKAPPQRTLMDAFELHNTEFSERVDKKNGKKGTLVRYQRLERKVKTFLYQKYGVRDVELGEIKKSLAPNFYHYLLMKDIGANTAMTYVKTLKQVINRAINEGWTNHNPCGNFKFSYVQPEREYLEKHEIEKIYNKVITVPRLEEVRDVFIFCCFTGYAYETTYNLTPENVFKGLDGKMWVSKDRAKTGTEETVPLMPIPLAILGKYKNHPYCVANNKLLPVNSNYRYNAYLKEIAHLCGISKKLTTHTARHTFATTVTLENDVPIETVGKMLGHKNLRTTQIYAQITKRKISNNMKELQDKLFDKDGSFKSVY